MQQKLFLLYCSLDIFRNYAAVVFFFLLDIQYVRQAFSFSLEVFIVAIFQDTTTTVLSLSASTHSKTVLRKRFAHLSSCDGRYVLTVAPGGAGGVKEEKKTDDAKKTEKKKDWTDEEIRLTIDEVMSDIKEPDFELPLERELREYEEKKRQPPEVVLPGPPAKKKPPQREWQLLKLEVRRGR